jgi:hypothetical protein
MSQSHWELIGKVLAGVWAGVGPLIGVLVGAYIANRNQRKQWIADSKKHEYQELITAMTRAFNAMLNRSAPMVAYGPEEQRAFAAAEDEALITISDRIFIWEELDKLKILQRWQELTRNLNARGDIQAFSNAVGEIRGSLIREAKKL